MGPRLARPEIHHLSQLSSLPAREGTVAAGPFGRWLEQFRAALRGDQGSEVPCGDCTGCCISGYSIQLRPSDERALARIPANLLVRAPGFPRGHLTMAPRANGVCPMLEAGQCTIYADRPQTCLDYDCRIFTAAGLQAGGADKEVINRRVREWRFSYPAEADRKAHDAVLAASSFIRHKRSSFPANRAPTAPTGIAVLAIKTYHVFLEEDVDRRSDAEIATAIVAASRAFDTGAQS
jgi:Fe-S-cluster containining protein